MSDYEKMFVMKQNEWIDACIEISSLKKLLEQKDKQIEILKNAVEFYGDLENWSYINQNCKISMKIDQEYSVNFTSTVAGKRARQALKQFNEMSGV